MTEGTVQPAAGPSQRFWGLLAVAAIAATIRSVGLRKDLWLDEVWSVQIANRMRSPLEVFTLHHEINHYLNTLWLYWMGPNASNLHYHLFPFLCGVGAVVMAVIICRRRNLVAAWAALLLFAFSYELVAYSTEARGYASVVLWALVAFDAFERYTAAPGLLWGGVYTGACILGILSQPIFVAVMAAAALESIYNVSPFPSGRGRRDSLIEVGAPGEGRKSIQILRPRPLFRFRPIGLALRVPEGEGESSAIRSRPNTLRPAILLHTVPFLALMTLWWADMRLVEIGGGTKAQSLITAYGTALAWAVGTVQNDFAQAASCGIGIVLIFLGIRRIVSESRIFFLGTIIAFPLLLVLARRSAVVYTRHFMIAAVFLLLLCSQLLGAWWSEGRRKICGLIVAVYVAVNVWNIGQFARNGRGEYTAALQDIVNRTPTAAVIIGGDQDFRVGIEVRYYLPRVLMGRPGAYRDQGSWPESGPHWIIVQEESSEPPTPPLEHFIDDRRNTYDFIRTYPTAPLSGLHWFIYRNRIVHPN